MEPAVWAGPVAAPYNTFVALRGRRERLLPGGVPGYV